MADWFIATEGVKVVKDSASLWPQIITAVSSAGAALGGVYLAHDFTRRREERAAAAKQVSERLFIATELVFLLEQFAEDCARVATDKGKPDQQGEHSPAVRPPELTVLDVSGDWRTLPSLIMYRVRELPVLQSEARRDIAAASEHSWPPLSQRNVSGASVPVCPSRAEGTYPLTAPPKTSPPAWYPP